MKVECIDNNGFEDLLTASKTYRVAKLRGNSVQLKDDSGQIRWYGRFKFSDPGCFSCATQQAA